MGAGVALVCVVGLGLMAGDGPHVQMMLAMFAVAVVTAVTATGLAGADPALDRTGAVDWRARRAAHVVAIGTLATVLGLVAGPPAATEVVVRGAVGLTGLAALGATLLGSGLAWCLPVVWTVAAISALSARVPPPAPLVTWPVQPPDTTAAMVAACVLGAVGLLVYAVRGPRAQ
jgi:hypothetical protein